MSVMIADALGAVLVTDAISAMGLPSGLHHLGSQSVEVRNNRAVIAGTDTLCGRWDSLTTVFLLLF